MNQGESSATGSSLGGARLALVGFGSAALVLAAAWGLGWFSPARSASNEPPDLAARLDAAIETLDARAEEREARMRSQLNRAVETLDARSASRSEVLAQRLGRLESRVDAAGDERSTTVDEPVPAASARPVASPAPLPALPVFTAKGAASAEAAGPEVHAADEEDEDPLAFDEDPDRTVEKEIARQVRVLDLEVSQEARLRELVERYRPEFLEMLTSGDMLDAEARQRTWRDYCEDAGEFLSPAQQSRLGCGERVQVKAGRGPREAVYTEVSPDPPEAQPSR